MRTIIAFVASLVMALVGSALTDTGSSQHVLTGTVGRYVAGEWISVANETTDPIGVQFTLRETTVFEGDSAFIRRGVPVTIWYRGVSERRLVADRVRIATARP